MSRCFARIVCAAVVVLMAMPQMALGQTFGRNKVQYEHFDFEVLKTANFDIYHYPEERAAVERAAHLAEQWRARLTLALGLPLAGRQPLVLYASQPHFGQTQVVDGIIGEGTGGVTEFLKRRMVMPFASSFGETSHVLGHEMVHAFQFDLGGEGALGLPLWFIEGMAEYLTLGRDHPLTAMWLRSAAMEEKIPGFEDFNDPQLFPYRYGHAAWAYLTSRYGEGIVIAAFLAAVESRDALTGIEQATGATIEDLSEGFRAAVRERHGRSGNGLNAPGRSVISETPAKRATLNVSPALSPDGKWLVYLSERSRYSLDLYLAEAATGRVVRRLTTTATDPHLESLQFVASAGAWDATSTRFAFTTVEKGKPILSIIDLGRDRPMLNIPATERELKDVDEAWHPTWSPDGRFIAFAGMSGGVSDLFVYEVSSSTVRRLTNDGFADLQPAWSPSGAQIVFVTDRFTSNLDRLQFGELRLGLLSMPAGEITALPALPTGKHLNPQWGAKGNSLVLVAAPDGVSNVYRLDLTSNQFSRVTNVATGVSGITDMSPALSYSPETNRLAYTVFDRGGYDIRILEDEALAAVGADAAQVSERSSVLFGDPATAINPRAAVSFDQPTPPSVPAVEPYTSKLKLDYIGSTAGVGVGGVGSRGAFVAGGIGLQFSDVLGYHTIGAQIQANGGLKDLGGQVTYLNRKSRWNWGAVGGLIPYTSRGFAEQLDVIDGQQVIVSQEYTFRQTELQLAGIALLPFSRTFRFEAQAGGRRLSFDRELRTQTFAFNTGELIAERKEDLDAPTALNLGEASAALVYDSSAVGPTGPIGGQRYRFEVSPTVGALQFTAVTLDYRRYFQPLQPFTFAVRALHYGRYGSDGQDQRLSPIFIGYSSLVRGYDMDSFDNTDCTPNAQSECPEFDQLVGSRMLVGNAELRFPLIGVFSGQYRYGPVPIEGFLFADSGVAWTAQTEPKFSGGTRPFVSSVGAGVRLNALGYVIVELAGVRALDRRGRGWKFIFNFSPAF